MKNTHVHYMYRDASNYKQHEAIILIGPATKEERSFLLSVIEFIPQEVGLEALQSRMESFPSDDDHVYHEITLVEETDLEATDSRSVAEFVAELQGAKDDVLTAMDELGIEY